MSNSNYNRTPAAQGALGIDPNGSPMEETWSYRSVLVGMPLYLSTNTRPDFAFAVSQVARFCHNSKKRHASAIKTLVRYLHRNCDMGMLSNMQATWILIFTLTSTSVVFMAATRTVPQPPQSPELDASLFLADVPYCGSLTSKARFPCPPSRPNTLLSAPP